MDYIVLMKLETIINSYQKLMNKKVVITVVVRIRLVSAFSNNIFLFIYFKINLWYSIGF